MPRVKEFDPDQALDAAMELFWEQGYAATSVQNLVDRMRINRFSIYDTFGNKHDLFLKALERYRVQVAGTLIANLANAPDGLGAIRRYFEAVVDHLSSPEGQKACLMINSIAEKAADDPEVRARCMDNLGVLEGAFLSAVERAQARGEIPAEEDPGALAEYLATSVLGLNVLAKADRRRDRLERSVELILKTLG